MNRIFKTAILSVAVAATTLATLPERGEVSERRHGERGPRTGRRPIGRRRVEPRPWRHS